MPRPLAEHEDAFGHALRDYLAGDDGAEIIERSDGYIGLSAGAETYLAQLDEAQRAIADRARGRVLDVGCGAGRYALYLQERGHEVVGIDISPGCVAICGERGVNDVRLLSITDIGPSLGTFDTVGMFGNNFGLFGTFTRARRLLARFRRIVSDGGRIIAQTLDPYRTSDPEHLAYHAHNRERGRMGGQIRMRVRYEKHATPWFDYLLVSPPEMQDIVRGTGWRIDEIIEGGGANFVAVLEREPGP
jgi:SAM-dependent methyltransferase